MTLGITNANSKFESDLKARATVARKTVVDKYVQAIVHPKNSLGHDELELVAWGQYIDNEGATPVKLDQRGIFGSAAGVQVLAMNSNVAYADLIKRALRILPLNPTYEGATDNGPAPAWVEVAKGVRDEYVDKGDTQITHKLAAILEAGSCVEKFGIACDPRPDISGTVADLLAMRLQGQGWPDFSAPPIISGPVPHTTSVVLYALSGCIRTQEIEDACVEALRWFADRDTARMSVATLSLIAMAIGRLSETHAAAVENNTFRTNPFEDEVIRDLRRKCEKVVSNWVRVSASDGILRSLEGTEYVEPKIPENAKASDRYRFLFYMPHCMAVLLLLSSDRLLKSSRHRRFILGTVAIVVDRVSTEQRFIAAGRQLASTVEHLWLSRMLYAFENTKIYKTWRYACVDWVRRKRGGRLIVASSFAGLVALVVSAILTEGALQAALISLVGVVAAAGVGVLALFVEHE